MKNKSEIKDLLLLQEKKLSNKEIEERRFNQTCTIVADKVKKSKNKLLMSTSCFSFRLKKETLEEQDEKAANLKMARVQDWVISLRGCSTKHNSFRGAEINSTNSSHSNHDNGEFRFGKSNLSLKNNTYKGKVLRHPSPKQLEEENKGAVKPKGKTEDIDHHKKYIDTYVNGKKIDSTEDYKSDYNSNRKMLVNIGSERTPIWANIKETSKIKKDEKILKPGNDTISHENSLQKTNFPTFYNTTTQAFNSNNNSNKLNNQAFPLVKVRSSSSSSTNNNQATSNNFLPAISLNKAALKNNLDQINKEILTVDTNENDFLDSESIKKRKNRILNKAVNTFYHNPDNKSFYIDNIKVDSKFLNEITWNKNANLYSKLITEEKHARENLNDLILVGHDLAAFERDWALKIPGKKLLYRQQEKGCYDEEIILTSFDRIVNKQYKETTLI